MFSFCTRPSGCRVYPDRAGGSIWVRVQTEDDAIGISVRDEGMSVFLLVLTQPRASGWARAWSTRFQSNWAANATARSNWRRLHAEYSAAV
jgi:hypothetical protein